MTMFHQNLKTMNDEQLSKVKDAYAEMIVDGLDHKDMYRIVFDYLRTEIDSATEGEIKEEIEDAYGKETWEGLIG
tara:strand:+ start:1070 stop:1294 length:225 start_codon:yes stop_codon:yes gene_type:complete